MKYMPLLIVLGAFTLGGCQTTEEVATERAESVCLQHGYGPGSQYHDYCVNSLKPAAIEVERQQRQERISNGIALLAKSVNRQQPKITCVQQGPVTQCY